MKAMPEAVRCAWLLSAEDNASLPRPTLADADDGQRDGLAEFRGRRGRPRRGAPSAAGRSAAAVGAGVQGEKESGGFISQRNRG